VLTPPLKRIPTEERITATEMKYMRKTAVHSWTAYKTKTDIVKEINTTTVLHKTHDYSRNMLQHTNRIPGYRLKRILKSYRPTGRSKK
jgi:hypothetical protein